MVRSPIGARIRRLATIVVAGALIVPAAAARAQDLACEPGDREVMRLDFVGNQTFTDQELEVSVTTTPSGFWRRTLRIVGTRRCLTSDSELARDVERLEKFYRDRGFPTVKVDTVIRALRPPGVAVTFRISEGAPLRVTSVIVSGIDSLPNAAALAAGLRTRVGERWGIVYYLADIDTIRTRLRNSGYPEPYVAQDYRTSVARLSAEVEFNVDPGPPARIGEIQINAVPPENGRRQISEEAVREVLGFREGSLFREREITAAQRRLYQMGTYRHVEVVPLLDAPDRVDSLVDVRVSLREDLMRQVDTELGWATLDCFRARAQYTDKNLFGTARRLELTANLSKLGFADPTGWRPTRDLCSNLNRDVVSSSDVNYFVGTTVRQPAVAPGRTVRTYSLYSERRGEYLAYLRTTIVGGEASLLRDLAPGTAVRGGYGLEYGFTQAEPALHCLVFSRCDAESRSLLERQKSLAIASLAFTRARTDNAFSPTRGNALRMELRGSHPTIGSASELTFVKGFADVVWYATVGARHNVLALRLRGGSILGSQSGGGSSGARLLPPQERLYAGGATSVRGFQQNELGSLLYLVDTVTVTQLNDSTRIYAAATGRPLRSVPVGGTNLLVANVEYRVPNPLLPNRLHHTFFSDFGDVWSSRSEAAGLGFKQLKWTPGTGVRYFSPIGPFQVNVGYNRAPRPAGPAFFAPPVSQSDQAFAPLYCVSGGAVVRRTTVGGVERWIQDEGPCPTLFVPEQRRGLLSKLVITFSYGPDF